MLEDGALGDRTASFLDYRGTFRDDDNTEGATDDGQDEASIFGESMLGGGSPRGSAFRGRYGESESKARDSFCFVCFWNCVLVLQCLCKLLAFFFNGLTLVNLERQQYTYSERVLPLRLAISLAVLRVSILTRPYSNYDSDRFFACCTYDRHTCFFSIDCLLATCSACSV